MSLSQRERDALTHIADGRTYVFARQGARENFYRWTLKRLSERGYVSMSRGGTYERSFTITAAGKSVLSANYREH